MPRFLARDYRDKGSGVGGEDIHYYSSPRLPENGRVRSEVRQSLSKVEQVIAWDTDKLSKVRRGFLRAAGPEKAMNHPCLQWEELQTPVPKAISWSIGQHRLRGSIALSEFDLAFGSAFQAFEEVIELLDGEGF